MTEQHTAGEQRKFIQDLLVEVGLGNIPVTQAMEMYDAREARAPRPHDAPKFTGRHFTGSRSNG